MVTSSNETLCLEKADNNQGLVKNLKLKSSWRFTVKIMGRVFLEHIGGAKLYSCAECNTNLTNKSELISTRFTGATGMYQFKQKQ